MRKAVFLPPLRGYDKKGGFKELPEKHMMSSGRAGRTTWASADPPSPTVIGIGEGITPSQGNQITINIRTTIHFCKADA